MNSSDPSRDNHPLSLEKMLERDGCVPQARDSERDSLLFAQQAAKRRANLALAVVPALVLLITFLFWYQTWFGRRLSADQMNQDLTDTSVPHKTQHALSQVADEISSRNPDARQWYPQVLALAANKETEFRVMSAWVMGHDNHSAEFHQALATLLRDPEPMVRRNAALALVRFGDAAAEGELVKMLQPYELAAPAAGRIEFRLSKTDEVQTNSVVARIDAGGAKPLDVRSPVEGVFERRAVAGGASVTMGETIAVISPSEQEVWESLRALSLIGGAESLAEVERFARGVPGMADRVRQQAALTAQAIQKRLASGK